MDKTLIENNTSDIVLGIDNGTDIAMSLGRMRNCLGEWYNNLREEITKIDFEDYDKALTIYDAAHNNEPVYYAIFEWGIPVKDTSTVYLSGIKNKELKGIIQKTVELDLQIDHYRKLGNKENQNAQQKI